MESVGQALLDLKARIGDWTGGHLALQAALVVGASLILAWLTQVVLRRWLGGLTRRTATDLDDRLLAVIHRPVFLTVLWLGLSVATGLLNLSPGYESAIVRLLQTLIVLVWTAAAFRATALVLEFLVRHRDRFALVEERTLPLFANLSKVMLFLAATYLLLKVWSVDATAFLTSAGIAGIALGFAAKDTLANLFSGIFILADTPYKVGDYIVLDTGERGQVSTIGLRSTRILTRDDIEITVPNAVIANAKIVNETGGPHPKERIRLKVAVAYGTDADRVCEVLQQTAAGLDGVCADPAPRVRFRSFGDSGLDFEIMAWIDDPAERGRMIHELGLSVYRTLRREGIEIPYPKRDVYLHRQPRGEDGHPE